MAVSFPSPSSAPQGPSSPAGPTLRAHVSPKTNFSFPAIHAFPPFFTQQPNATTWAHQAQLWAGIVLGWCRHTRTFRVAVEREEGEEEDLWGNKEIGRKLKPATRKELLSLMVKNGQADWQDPTRTSAWIYWRKPADWADLIYSWVSDTGQLNSVLTFWELLEGDLSHTTEFHNLPIPLLRRALDVLMKQGKAQTLRGTEDAGPGGEGVKFV